MFFLPPPAALRVMTLGHRAATTDLLWAELLLEVGLHWQEKRPFPYIPRRQSMAASRGQVITFLAPSFLTDKEGIERWRTDGTHALTRAVELGRDAQRSLSAGSLLGKAGGRKATFEHLQRAYAMTDDMTMRDQFALRLKSLSGRGSRRGRHGR